jgi:hypothetical protein
MAIEGKGMWLFRNRQSSGFVLFLILIFPGMIGMPNVPGPASTGVAEVGGINQISHATTDESILASGQTAFARLDLYANIETVGVVVSGTGLPENAVLMYRPGNDPNWRTGHPLMRIDDGRLVGSLFGLSAATTYEVKVMDGSAEITGSATTQPDELPYTPSNIIYVKADAQPGGDGSIAAPFKTIQEGVNHAAAGTQVLVADGTYHESVVFPASGTPGNWIRIKAEGTGAILDGSTNLANNIWKPHSSRKNVWFTKISGPVSYVGRDQKRFYAYDDLSGLLEEVGHSGVPIGEGWYFEPSTSNLYVRNTGDPSRHAWQVPDLNYAFNADGRDWLWIEGFEMRFYGGSLNGSGVYMKNSSHVVIRRNKIHNIQLGIFIEWTGGEDRGNDTRIEYNEIYDPLVNEWPWAAVKGSSMEGTAIVVRGHVGAIVRGNEVHHFFNGIYTGSSAALENPGVAFDADIYNNRIHHIGDDGLEPEGTCINQRFRNNTIDHSLVGISIAPVTQGPTWVLRSTFTNYTGTSIKWDKGSDGIVLIYHNTSWTNAPGLNAMSMVHAVHNSVMRNNIFQGNGYAFEEPFSGSSRHDWNNNNWYTTRGANGPHFKWENINYSNVTALCAATGLECKGYEDVPGLTNPAGGDFTLLPSSPNVDHGVLVPGINDTFSGTAPDVGAYERVAEAPPAVTAIVRADTNPTSAGTVNFTITFSEEVVGVDTVAPYGDLALVSSSGITGSSITGVTWITAKTYTVTVNTGSGAGTLALNLVDNDSILDNANNPLGGAGAGNGNFSGETYSINKGLTVVTSIVRTDPDQTALGNVHFSVNFSGNVNGVTADDFLLAAENVSGAAIVEVAGSGAAYTVTVNTGTGDGTLRLDLVDNDSVTDSANIPLGGAGAGNASFTAGETYTINRASPVVISILRADPDPTTAGTVRFLVAFSEAVDGVDAGDFAITVTGGISGAQVIQVNGFGNTYMVTVATGTGRGNLRVDLVDNDTILDLPGLALGGPGNGNGSFVAGEMYSINKPVVTLLAASFRSNGGNDGWILESGENSTTGGTKDSSAGTFRLGDDSRDRQYRVILHFPTSTLPDNAVVTQVILVIKKQGLAGTDPFSTHLNISIDIRKGPFGSLGPFGVSALQVKDFQAPADMAAAGTMINNPVGDNYWSLLNGTAGQLINLKGITQFRLMFELDDNDDMGNDYLAFFSGDYKVLSDRPQLQVEYYVPR